MIINKYKNFNFYKGTIENFNLSGKLDSVARHKLCDLSIRIEDTPNQNNYYRQAFNSRPLNENLLDIVINSSHFSKENISKLCISIVKDKNN